MGDDLHDVVREPALEQFQQRADLAAAPPFEGRPLLARQRLDRHLDVVKLRAGDLGLDAPLGHCQVANRAVADVGAAAGQPVLVVAERLQVLAPGLAPEALGDLAAVDLDGLNVNALFPQGFHLLQRLPTPFGDGNVRGPTAVSVSIAYPYRDKAVLLSH